MVLYSTQVEYFDCNFYFRTREAFLRFLVKLLCDLQQLPLFIVCRARFAPLYGKAVKTLSLRLTNH